MKVRALGFAVLGGFGVLGVSGALFACSSDSAAESAEDAAEPACEGDLPAFRFPHGDDGSADPFGARAAGQARAGKIREASQIVQPDDARSKVRVGDFVLTNQRIAVYVEAARESDGYNPLGGEIVALEVIGPDGRPLGVSRYDETLVMIARQSVHPERVSVIANGEDGKAAIVRASGKLANVPFLDTFKGFMPDEYDFPAALDYVLEPGASRVVLRLNLVNTKLEPVDLATKQFLGFFQGSRSQAFTEGSAFGEPRGESPWVAFDSPKSAFLIRSLASPVRAELGAAGFQLFSLKGLALDACATKTVDYAEAIVGTGLDDVLETKRATLGEPAWRELRGTLQETNGGGLADAFVHVTAPDGRYLTRTTTGANGAFVVHAPSGAVSLTPTLKGWAIPQPTPVAAEATDVTLTLPQRATLDVTIEDATTNEPLPARVQVVPAATIAGAPEAFGIRYEEADGRLWQDLNVTGHSILPVPPGAGHRVIVTRGYEYEIFETTVAAAAGETTKIEASLTRSVDSPGVMCADFHIHSHFSPDSSDTPEIKVRGALADGLEIPVSSEHDWIVDFQPIIQKLGMTKWAYGFPSEELTTFTWGHFGVIPLFPKPDATNNGAVEWIGKSPDEIFRMVNDLPEKPVLVVNHPSQGGLSAYFVQAAFDREAAIGRSDLWSDQFAALEVFNDSDFEANRDGSVADWFALLNAGKTYWTTGSSDSHREATNPVGYPRTCLRFGHDDPTKLSAEIVRDALRAGAATISGGLTMTVEAPGGTGPGGTSTKGSYKVAIACPSWLSATSLEVIVDGVTTETRPLTPSAGPGPGKRYEATIEVAPQSSKPRHWVLFHAKGTGTATPDLAPLHPGRRPFAVSNPIFFAP